MMEWHNDWSVWCEATEAVRIAWGAAAAPAAPQWRQPLAAPATDAAGPYFATTSPKGEITVWDALAGKELARWSVDRRINLVRIYQYPTKLAVAVFLHSAETEVSDLQLFSIHNQEIRKITAYQVPSDLKDMRWHPQCDHKIILIHSFSIELWDFVHLDKPVRESTDLKQYLRLAKYYKPEIDVSGKVWSQAIPHKDKSAILFVWVENSDNVCLLTDAWPNTSRFRVEGSLNVKFALEDQAGAPSENWVGMQMCDGLWRPHTDLEQMARSKRLFNFISSTKVTPSKAPTINFSQVAINEGVHQIYLAAYTETRIVVLPIYVVLSETHNSVYHSLCVLNIHTPLPRCLGSHQSRLYASCPLPETDGEALIVMDPNARRFQTAGEMGQTATATVDEKGNFFACSLHRGEWSLKRTAYPWSAGPDNVQLSVSALEPPAESHSVRSIFNASAGDVEMATKGTAAKCTAKSIDDRQIEDTVEPYKLPSTGLYDADVLLTMLRQCVTEQLAAMKSELVVTFERQLAQTEASIVQRLQKHTLSHVHEPLVESMHELSATLQERMETCEQKIKKIPQCMSAAITTMSRAGTSAQMQAQIGPRKLTSVDTETTEFVKKFGLDCIFADSDEDDHFASKVNMFKDRLKSQKYDVAVYAAACLDMEDNTDGFWTILITKAFAPNELYECGSKSIAMAAVRMLTQSMGDWQDAATVKDARCIKATWKNEVVLVPMGLITKCHTDIENRLQWIQHALGVARVGPELNEDELKQLLHLMRRRIKSLANHLRTSPSLPISDKLVQRCVLLTEIIEDSIKKIEDST